MTLKVFIVDDEEPARERLKELLGDIAPEVPTAVVGEARNGVEAVEQIPASEAQVAWPGGTGAFRRKVCWR